MWKWIVVAVATFTAGLAEPVPNYGIAISVPNSAIITVGSNNIATGVTQINGAIGSLSTTSSNANISAAATTISTMVKTLATLSTAIKNSITAANSNKVSVGASFGAINASVLALTEYLGTTAAEAITNLTDSLGGSNVATINTTLIALGTGLTKIASSLAAMETAINATVTAAAGATLTSKMVMDGIPTSLATAVNTNVNLIKTGLSGIVTPVKNIVTGITSANTFLTSIATTIQNANTTSLNSVKTMASVMSALKISVTTYANAAVRSMKADWTAAVAKLAVFSTNSTLKEFVTNHATFSTKNSTDFYTTFVETAVNTTAAAVANLTNALTAEIANITGEAIDAAAAEATQLSSKIAAGSTVCSTKYSANLTSLILGVSSSLSMCTTTATTMLNLAIAQYNNVLQAPIAINNFYTSAIASCSKYSTFAKDPIVYGQALACLTSSATFGTDNLEPILTEGVAEALDYLSVLSDPTSLIGATITNCYAFQKAQITAGFTALSEAIAAC